MVRFLVGEALRDLRRAGWVAASAIVLITLSLVALGAFSLLSSNLGRAVAHWRDRVRIIVYLRAEPSPEEGERLLARVRALPHVAEARLVGKAEALASLRSVLGKDASVLDQLPANPLPASIEVTPTAAGAAPGAARDLLSGLAALPESEEVAGGGEWVDRLDRWRRLLAIAGAGLGSVLAVAAVLVVTTATTLALHVRRHETAIMRLVGASEVAVRLPLLLQGMLQGFLGALVAWLVLAAGHRVLQPHVEPLLALTLGLPGFAFLPTAALLGLVAAGTLLGALGGWLARGGSGR